MGKKLTRKEAEMYARMLNDDYFGSEAVFWEMHHRVIGHIEKRRKKDEGKTN